MIFDCKTPRRGAGGVVGVGVASVSACNMRRSTALVDFSLSAATEADRWSPVNFPLIICYSGFAMFHMFISPAGDLH
jgi:hypothetical protein